MSELRKPQFSFSYISPEQFPETPQTYVRRKTLELYHYVRRRRPVHRSIAFVDRGRSVNRLPRDGILRRAFPNCATWFYTDRTYQKCDGSSPSHVHTLGKLMLRLLSSRSLVRSRNLSDRSTTPSRFRRWPIFDYLDACHPTPYCKLIASNWKTFSGYPGCPASSALSFSLSLSLS